MNKLFECGDAGFCKAMGFDEDDIEFIETAKT